MAFSANQIEAIFQDFLESLRTSKAAGLASVVSKVDSDWPTSKIVSNKTIDIWWVIHDGGLIILLSYLLKQNAVWKNCRLRLFAVAEENDNSIKMVSEGSSRSIGVPH